MTEGVVDQLQYDGGPTALILSDTDEGAMRAAQAVMLAGGRVVSTARLDRAEWPDERWVPSDAIFVSVGQGATIRAAHARGLIDRLAAGSGAPRIVSASLSALDDTASAFMATPVTILCDASVADAAFELALAWFGADGPRLQDISSELDPLRIQRLADEVSRIAKVLSSLATHDPRSPLESRLNDVQRGFTAEPAEQPASCIKASDIRAMLRRRRLRNNFFDATLFADPAWDMLLDLMAARLDGEEVAVSSLCIAAAVPPTTALRWIRAMTDQGLFERHDDPTDGRRIFIRLTDKGAQAMNGYFSATEKLEGLPS